MCTMTPDFRAKKNDSQSCNHMFDKKMKINIKIVKQNVVKKCALELLMKIVNESCENSSFTNLLQPALDIH